MRDVLTNMRECGKYANMRDFPHDCGMVDTYAISTYRQYMATSTILNTSYLILLTVCQLRLYTPLELMPHFSTCDNECMSVCICVHVSVFELCRFIMYMSYN